MARYQHLPLWRDANRLLRVLEQSVRQFPLYINTGCAGSQHAAPLRSP